MRTLTRPELTAALAARQGLIERWRVDPAEAIRRLTPLQGQEPVAPFIALAARLEGFTRADLEAAIDARRVVKTTIMRMTLHLAAAADYPAYAQLTRQARMRTWRKQYPHLDEERLAAELGAWLREPRTNREIRDHVGAYDGVPDDPYAPVIFARTLLPLVQLPPAGPLGRPAPPELRARPAAAPAPRRRRHPRGGALPRGVRAREPPRPRVVVGRRPARLRRRLGAARDRRLPRREGRRAARPPRPAAAARGHAAAPALPLPLGPGAARLRRPRPDHGARDPGAEAHAQRRPDRHGRRARRRELGRSATTCWRSRRTSSSRAGSGRRSGRRGCGRRASAARGR